MRVLVLGATGGLGCHCALALRKTGHEVVAVGHRQSDGGFFADFGIDFIGGFAIEKQLSFEMLPTDVDAVINMAGAMPSHVAETSMPYVQSIVVGTVNLCEWMIAHSIRRIIFNTTPSDIAHHFGKPIPVPVNASRSFPKDGGDHAVYTICKNAAVDLLEHYRIANGLLPCVFRHMTVYTPGRPDVVNYKDGRKVVVGFGKIIQVCKSGGPVEVWGDPNRKKELLGIQDFARAIVMAVDKPNVTGLFNLAGLRPYTLEEQIDGLIAAYAPNGKCNKIYCPEKPATPQNLLDDTLTQKELGWKAQMEWVDICKEFSKVRSENFFHKLWGYYSI